jgi:FkbM family methyltransferase
MLKEGAALPYQECDMIDFTNWLCGEKINIIDIGARMTPGEATIYQNLIKNNLCTITAVEPDTSTNELLVKLSNAKIYNLALGTKGLSYLNICQLPSCSSLLEPDTETLSKYSGMEYFYNVIDRVSLHVDEMDDIFQDEIFDFLSIDVQGAELNVLENGRRNLSNLLGIHIEVSFIEKYKGQPLFRDVDTFLAGNDFSFHCFTGYGTRSPRGIEIDNSPINGINQWLWADAFYFHNLYDIDFWKEPGKLIKLACIFHNLYKSYDFSAHCLKIHDHQFGSNYLSEYASLISNLTNTCIKSSSDENTYLAKIAQKINYN